MSPPFTFKSHVSVQIKNQHFVIWRLHEKTVVLIIWHEFSVQLNFFCGSLCHVLSDADGGGGREGRGGLQASWRNLAVQSAAAAAGSSLLALGAPCHSFYWYTSRGPSGVLTNQLRKLWKSRNHLHRTLESAAASEPSPPPVTSLLSSLPPYTVWGFVFISDVILFWSTRYTVYYTQLHCKANC